ncbi:MAG: hypothetical protein QW112_00140, partial [Candidatus Micrarchaeia archaeon]
LMEAQKGGEGEEDTKKSSVRSRAISKSSKSGKQEIPASGGTLRIPNTAEMSLMKQTLIAISLFMLAVIIFTLTYRPPVSAPFPNASIANNDTQPNIYNISAVNATCSEYLAMGGRTENYEYLIVSSGISTYLKSSFAGSELKDGVEYYVRESEITTTIQEQTLKANMRTYMDKNYTCLFQETWARIGQREIREEKPCDGSTALLICKDSMLYLGDEDITIMAGTFSTKKYEIPQGKIWISEGIEVPVKIETSSGITELVSYYNK